MSDSWLNVADLVTNGLASSYKQYWENCPNRDAIAAAEEMANQSGAGVWLGSENMPPWEWRRQNK